MFGTYLLIVGLNLRMAIGKQLAITVLATIYLRISWDGLMPATEQKQTRMRARRHLECMLIRTTAAHEMACFKF